MASTSTHYAGPSGKTTSDVHTFTSQSDFAITLITPLKTLKLSYWWCRSSINVPIPKAGVELRSRYPGP